MFIQTDHNQFVNLDKVERISTLSYNEAGKTVYCIVYYTVSGVQRTQNFETEEEANEFLFNNKYIEII